MDLEIYQFIQGAGWDREPDTSLDSEKTLVILFGASQTEIIKQPVAELNKGFPQSVIIGCSTAGEIYDTKLSGNSLVVAIVRFIHTRLKIAHARISDPSQSYRVGCDLAEQLASADLRGLLLLSEGLTINGSKLIRGLNDELPDTVTITGGMAGDDARFEKTWVLHHGELRSDAVCAVGLYGNAVGIGYGAKGGWNPLGPEREVTRSKDNVLYELNGIPALDIYKKYLGERAADLPASGLLFPLSIREENMQGEPKIRGIHAIDEQEKSMTFAGDIPIGSQVRLMWGNFDRIIDGAASAARSVDTAGYQGGPLLSIAISCVGRRLVLGQRAEEETEAILDVLPEQTSQIGFYSYGELSPLADGRCDLHNETMTMTLIWERLD